MATGPGKRAQIRADGLAAFERSNRPGSIRVWRRVTVRSAWIWRGIVLDIHAIRDHGYVPDRPESSG